MGNRIFSRLKIAHCAMGVALVLLAGCTTSEYLNETRSVDVTGAYQLADRETFESIDLSNLLCQYAPQGDIQKCVSLGSEGQATSVLGEWFNGASSTSDNSKRIDKALHYFNEQIQKNSDPQQKKSSRNGLQERLLAASAQRCNAYKGNLQRTFSRTNFGLGMLSTIAGTAGAIANTAATASAWSGISAISSGTRAEFNQDYMSNLAAYVIVDGIDKRRQNIYEQIQKHGQSKNYDAYPVEAAIKDALLYHGQCSVIAGFQEASDSIKYANEPGLNTAINSMAKIQAANLMLHDKSQTPDTLITAANKITSTSSLIAGTTLVDKQGDKSAFDEFRAALEIIQVSNNNLEKTLAEITAKAKADDVLKNKLSMLGLDQQNKVSVKIEENLRESCLNKITGNSNSEYKNITKADMEKNLSASEVLMADAAVSRAQSAKVIATLKHLAERYRLQVDKTIHEWNEAFNNIKGEDANKMDAFKSSLDAKRLDQKLLNDLLQVCS